MYNHIEASTDLLRKENLSYIYRVMFNRQKIT